MEEEKMDEIRNNETYEAESVNITPIIEFLNNIKFLAAAYNQMWVIKKMKLNGEYTIAFVDDRTGETKMILVNPDTLMQQAIDEIVANGWFSVKEDYLLTNERYFDESRVVLAESENAPENTSEAPWGIE